MPRRRRRCLILQRMSIITCVRLTIIVLCGGIFNRPFVSSFNRWSRPSDSVHGIRCGGSWILILSIPRSPVTRFLMIAVASALFVFFRFVWYTSRIGSRMIVVPPKYATRHLQLFGPKSKGSAGQSERQQSAARKSCAVHCELAMSSPSHCTTLTSHMRL